MEPQKNPLETSKSKDTQNSKNFGAPKIKDFRGFDSHQKQNVSEIRNKIISLLKIRGPSLPVHMAREIGLSTIFSGAFLSELASEKTIKISNLKVGSSPLYYLPGQEQLLENFYKYLPGKERETFLLLKKRKILEDSKQEPAIRVALRNIKDFAIPFVNNTERGQVLYWHFYSFTEEQVKELFEKKKMGREEEKEIKPEIVKPVEIGVEKSLATKPEIKTKLKEIEALKNLGTLGKEVEKPLITIKEKPKETKYTKEKSDFVKNILNILIRENIEIVEEKEVKKREYQAIVRINSDIGKLSLFLVAKDKRKITESDLSLAIQKAQSLKMPSLFMSQGEPNKKALAYLQQYEGLIKFKRYKTV